MRPSLGPSRLLCRLRAEIGPDSARLRSGLVGAPTPGMYPTAAHLRISGPSLPTPLIDLTRESPESRPPSSRPAPEVLRPSGAVCAAEAQPAVAGANDLTLGGCTLEAARRYTLRVYLTNSRAGEDAAPGRALTRWDIRAAAHRRTPLRVAPSGRSLGVSNSGSALSNLGLARPTSGAVPLWLHSHCRSPTMDLL